MTVHFRAYLTNSTLALSAPCGYVFQKRLRGLDFTTTWDQKAPTPVDCLDCLMHAPKKRKVLPWHADADRRR